MRPIGVVRSPFPEGFGVPRQPGLVPHRACIELDPERLPIEALRGLEHATHVWVVFLFDRALARPWRPTVRPPRLGGNARLGVLATRSPFRPNPIGLSAVRLLEIRGHTLDIEAGDFIDGTPVLDLKPYVPYADRKDDARLEWAAGPPLRLPVRFTEDARATLAHRPALARLVADVVAADPRPAYHDDDREYGLSLDAAEIRFRVTLGEAWILAVTLR